MKSLQIPFAETSLSGQTNLPPHIIKNRQILAEAMGAAGFTNYPMEYWHWSYGDVMWAELNHKSQAFYGPISQQ